MTSVLKHYLSALCIVALTACSSTKPATQQPAAVSKQLYTNDQAWAVKIDDGWFTAKTITFGPYHTSSRTNGVVKDTSLRFIRDPKEAFSFNISSQEEKITVQTLYTSRIAFLSHPLPSFLNNLPPTTPLFYTLIKSTGQPPLPRWEMILKKPTYLELNDNKIVGILRTEKEEIRISAHNKFGIVNAYEKLTFEFRLHGQPVAAVMPGEQPSVWVSQTVSTATRPVLAAAIAALLCR